MFETIKGHASRATHKITFLSLPQAGLEDTVWILWQAPTSSGPLSVTQRYGSGSLSAESVALRERPTRTGLWQTRVEQKGLLTAKAKKYSEKCNIRTRVSQSSNVRAANRSLDYEQSLFLLSPSNKTRENAHARDCTVGQLVAWLEIHHFTSKTRSKLSRCSLRCGVTGLSFSFESPVASFYTLVAN